MLKRFERQMVKWADDDAAGKDPDLPEFPLPPYPGEDFVDYFDRWWKQMKKERLTPVDNPNFIFDMVCALLGNTHWLDSELGSSGGAALSNEEVHRLLDIGLSIDDFKGISRQPARVH